MRTLKRRYPSKLASVSKARRDIAAFARTCGLAGPDISDIALAAGEACNNAAEHGHTNGGFFSVNCLFEGNEMAVEVCDAGRGFDPRGKGVNLAPEQLGLRGLGIFIMRSIMDDVHFHTNVHGTCVRMSKFGLKIQAPPNGVYAGRGRGKALAAGDHSAVHHTLKALFELARTQVSGRRQR